LTTITLPDKINGRGCDMKEYFNIINIQEYKPQFSGLLVFLPVFVFILVIVFTLYIDGKQRNRKFAIAPFIVFMFLSAVFVTGYFTLYSNTDLIKLKAAYINKSYETVEGVVKSFDPMPYGGHKDEAFDVNGVKFSYSDYGSTVGYRQAFRRTRSHGGPIYAGAYVKIYYIHDEGFNDNFIIGLWVKEDLNIVFFPLF
jgi:hypothetical protein